MTSPDAIVSILDNTYQCSYVQNVSSLGFFTEESCQYFTNVVREPCGCSSNDDTDAPTIPGDIPDTVDPPINTVEPSKELADSTESPADNIVLTDPPLASNPKPDIEEEFGDACNPCGRDREMTQLSGMVNVPSQGLFSCQELAIMGRVATEDEDWCLLIKPFVQTPCGCQAMGPTSAPTEAPEPIEETQTETPTFAAGAAKIQFSILSLAAVSLAVLCSF
jgi:hypothetical protein